MSNNLKLFDKSKLILSAVIALFFIISMGYFLGYKFQDFPDGAAHMGYVNDVIQRGFPDYRYGLYSSGDKYNHLNHPALYYLIAGYAVRLLGLQAHAVITAQIVNIIIGALIIILSFNILKRISTSYYSILIGLSIFFLLPMFPLLCASVSNDPLSFLGCSVFLFALVKMKDDDRARGILVCLFVGGAIAALSKATAALVIICMFALHFVFFSRQWIMLVKKSKLRDYAIPLLCMIMVAGYYVIIHIQYGSFFPAPQKGPDEMFRVMNPGAERLALFDYFKLFLTGNVFTLTQPYGHVEFEDSLLRISLIKWLIYAIAAGVTLLVIFSKPKTDARKMALSLVIAFIVFAIFYFIALRNMHMHTGYQGATQARYFFGFLSGFALCITVAFDFIKYKIARAVVCIAIVAMTLANFYPSWVRVYSYPGVMHNLYVAQNSFYLNYGGLKQGRIFQQTFTAQSSRLLKAEFMIGTYSRVNHSTLQVQLLTTDGQLLNEQKIDASTIADNTWVPVTFPSVALTNGQHYILQLSSPDADENSFVTWWAAKRDTTEFPAYAGTKNGPVVFDFYSGGDAIVDGKLQKDSDFAFKLYFGESNSGQ